MEYETRERKGFRLDVFMYDGEKLLKNIEDDYCASRTSTQQRPNQLNIQHPRVPTTQSLWSRKECVAVAYTSTIFKLIQTSPPMKSVYSTI